MLKRAHDDFRVQSILIAIYVFYPHRLSWGLHSTFRRFSHHSIDFYQSMQSSPSIHLFNSSSYLTFGRYLFSWRWIAANSMLLASAVFRHLSYAASCTSINSPGEKCIIALFFHKLTHLILYLAISRDYFVHIFWSHFVDRFLLKILLSF